MLDWDELCSESQSNFLLQLRATEQNNVSNPRSHRRSPLRCLHKSEIQTRHCGCAERDDVTDRDIQRGAQWPVCRSWCQCHPLSTVLFLSPGVCYLDPGVPGKSPRYPPDAALSLRPAPTTLSQPIWPSHSRGSLQFQVR